MAYIERAITDVLKNRVKSSKCVLVTGARQVGKSTVIRHEFPGFNRANFDDRLTRLQAREEPRLFFLNHPCPLFIDEVQKESGVLEEIKMQIINLRKFKLRYVCQQTIICGKNRSRNFHL